MRLNNDKLDQTFSALADPTRRAILARLASGDATVNELARPFEMSLPAISKHLKVLEQAGLVAQTRDGQRRPRRLAPARLAEAGSWIEKHCRSWTERLDRLDGYLQELQAKEKRHGKAK